MFGFYSDSQAPFYGEQQINIFNCVSLSEFFYLTWLIISSKENVFIYFFHRGAGYDEKKLELQGTVRSLLKTLLLSFFVKIWRFTILMSVLC